MQEFEQGSIFYWHSVVGGVVSGKNVKYGGAMQCAVTFWETDRAKKRCGNDKGFWGDIL